MAFLTPSIQFFFGLPRALFCSGIHLTATLGNRSSAILWTWPLLVEIKCIYILVNVRRNTIVFSNSWRKQLHVSTLFCVGHQVILVSTWWWHTQKRAETCSCFLQQFENTVVLRRTFIHLTFILLMSYIYRAPCKARNFNVIYIRTYVWQRWKPSLSICCIMFQHWINAESYPVSQLCVNTLLATKVTLITSSRDEACVSFRLRRVTYGARGWFKAAAVSGANCLRCAVWWARVSQTSEKPTRGLRFNAGIRSLHATLPEEILHSGFCFYNRAFR
jgi:hypothetical protein